MKKTAVVRIDGGICSQIAQYALGKYFEEQGFSVYYDLSWFVLDGKDLEGNRNRVFNLRNLIPDANISKSSIIRTWKYRKRYNFDELNYELLSKLQNRIYLGTYYELSPQVYKEMPKLMRFNPRLNEANKVWAGKIECDSRAVAVHVRRGDMSKATNDSYWKQLTEEYYFKAMREFSDSVFYFFSDDVQWVADNIVNDPRMSGKDYFIVENNSDSDGYLDLYLLSKFSKWICSEGSLGKFGCIFSESVHKRIVLAKNNQWVDIYNCLGNVEVSVIEG